MARLNLKDIERRTEKLGRRENYDREFIFELLEAYGKPKSSITRLRTGSLNVAVDPEREVAQKNVVYFRESDPGHALKDVDELSKAAYVLRYTPRFIIATDFDELVALDTKTRENLAIGIATVDQHFAFFLPWAGMEKAQYTSESHADVRAAERMGQLFDELLAANPSMRDDASRHGLNVFFTRLLFCFFAEDTGIFATNQFTNAVGSHTLDDGSDTCAFLMELFSVLDIENPADKPTHLRNFPYVNGRLFSRETGLLVPKFTRKAREHLLGLGALLWKDINPDIFGSMFQAVVDPGQRSDLGQHYTSVPNILKTIEPLFLDELKENFDAAFDSTIKLLKLHDRIANIKIFDPACGSGNFLVIAYKELRRLEHAILEQLAQLDQKYNALWSDSRINIENFYGIEIDDFAAEVAVLSLWIAKHQMNEEFKDKFGTDIPLIPLKEAGKIAPGNACRLDWKVVCPNGGEEEIYLISNPPYGGSKKQSKEQKEDYSFALGERPYSKNLDYVALWFIKGSDYISGTRAEMSLVATNSVAQGEHVALMFPMIFEMGLEIGYAYTSFKWENNAKRNAGVTVVVIALRNLRDTPKYIFTDGLCLKAENINGYLADAPNIVVSRLRSQIFGLPEMSFGSMPRDGGNLLLEDWQVREIIDRSPGSRRWFLKYVGSSDFIKGESRYCLWIPDCEVVEARKIGQLAERLDRVSSFRESSKALSIKKYSQWPNRFVQRAYKSTNSIIVPRVSSARRDYIPMGYLGPDTVISDAANAVYDAEPWLFALLTSKMHMVWTRAVGGKMKTDYRYSNTIVYNNFPVPELSEADKKELTRVALRVLDVREYHCEFTLAELYDPGKMPDSLRQAHDEVDAVVDGLYSKRVFDSDGGRLSHLFARYRETIEAEGKTT